MAVAIDGGDAPRPALRALPTLPSGEVDIRRVSGFIGGVRCPYCGGNLAAHEGDVACLLCARVPYRLGLDADGRVALRVRDWTPPQVSRAGMGEAARTRRAASREQGRVGLAARILALVPRPPEYASISLIRSRLRGRGMTIDNPEILAVLEELIAEGYVASLTYAGGYRTGYHRTDGAALAAVPEEPS